MGAADDRVAELLDRWLASVELHARYLALDDAAYAAVEDWPRHQRPTRWLVDIARARCLELKRQLEERRARRDEGFADALELMAFITNLMGSEHVERFIPLATGRPAKRPPAPVPTTPATTPLPVPARAAPGPSNSTSTTATVEVAKPAAATARTASRARSTSATGRHARSASTGRHARPQAPAPRRVAAEPARTAKPTAPQKAEAAATPPASAAIDATTTTVIADAVRMLNWGREWPQLAGLIARLAGRPSEADVWEILRRHRATIEAKATRPAE
jgi:hypothetical protein